MVVKLQKSLTCKHDGIMCWHFISEYNQPRQEFNSPQKREWVSFERPSQKLTDTA